MNFKTTILIVCLLSSIVQTSFSCSIFTASKEGLTLAAGNEDWSDPQSRLWVSPSTSDRYGSINFGHSDFQVQTAINEHGLYFDYAVIDEATGKSNQSKLKYNTDIIYEIIGKCKTVEEALVYFRKYQYSSAFHQLLMGDATGRSIVVNQDIIKETDLNYQIATNFNVDDLDGGTYDCRRYEILDTELSTVKNLSIDLFRNLLSRVHQEGAYGTQYSYIFDLTNFQIYLYSFHNYEQVITLNIKQEIANGFRMENMKELFPPSFEEEYVRINHQDNIRYKMSHLIKTEGLDAAFKIHKQYFIDNKPEDDFTPLAQLIETALSLVREVWVEEKNQSFTYWWHTSAYADWQSASPKLQTALSIYDHVESIPKENVMQNIGTFEQKALVLMILGDIPKAKYYFEETMKIAPEDSGNYQRAELLLSKLKK